jgi:hypothetical protein
MEREFRPKTP